MIGLKINADDSALRPYCMSATLLYALSSRDLPKLGARWLAFVSFALRVHLRVGDVQIKKDILKALRQKQRVMIELERKVNTSTAVLMRHLRELEFLGLVKLTRHKKHPQSGRAFTVVELAERRK